MNTIKNMWAVNQHIIKSIIHIEADTYATQTGNATDEDIKGPRRDRQQSYTHDESENATDTYHDTSQKCKDTYTQNIHKYSDANIVR